MKIITHLITVIHLCAIASNTVFNLAHLAVASNAVVAAFSKLLKFGFAILSLLIAIQGAGGMHMVDPLFQRLKALLHGHSNSAHALGCMAAVKSIQWFKDPCSNMLFLFMRKLPRGKREIGEGDLMDVDHEDIMLIMPPLFALKHMPENLV
ncbi:hypothetical protein Ahy_A09g046059 [Arachis hypogaea]|uniref:Uncharacterized protein n=1 Tax=Arachis hypogaea TaxID=3818 RepID=A0A445BNS8_ARAHY|nr:hypothetical protein Ahy_A09g046059 [Arachis hypogaea]